MRINVLPKTSLGRWSVGLAAAIILLLVLLCVFAGQGDVGPGPFSPIATVAFGISGIAALVTGLISIVKNKERSVLVFVAALSGLFVLIFFLVEFQSC